MHQPSCPWLPEIDAKIGPESTRRHGSNRSAAFYHAALSYAQSHWRHGKPAQAILQLNKAWTADLSESHDVLATWPAPYRALHWILRQPCENAFIGNPVRHFQHLATRVVGARKELRSWRAWACFHLSERHLPRTEFPRDEIQIAREGIWIPGVESVSRALSKHGWPGECAAWHDAMNC